MKEQRIVKQIEKYDENGELEYTIIPNYRQHDNFLTNNELKFYKVLIIATKTIREKYNIDLKIFTQVALNRLIDVNNQRKMNELFDKISMKSIDFVLYDMNNNKVQYCIELDDETHNQEKRIERDKLLDKVFQNNINFIHIKRQEYYDIEEIIKLIV